MADLERWPPVYDADDLVREIKRLVARDDLHNAFYEWRADRSIHEVGDVCQGDIVELSSSVPLIDESGAPAAYSGDNDLSFWMVIGNSCDMDRDLKDVQWTQAIPTMVVQSGAPREFIQSLKKYETSRAFYLPPWSSRIDGEIVADLLRPVTVHRAVFPEHAKVRARLSRAAWILLNACLVRFLARDDGRFAA